MAGPLITGGGSAIAATARPTGPGYIRFEDLYRSKDTVSGALARLTSPKVVTFPEGRFVCRDFDANAQAGISVPPICRGLIGSGRGTLGGSTGTIFTMQARSSTKGNGARDARGQLFVPVQGSSTPTQLNLMKQVSQLAPSVWRNFQIAGSDQGHVYSAFQVWGTVGANTFENLLVNGWDGNAGSPPGETSGLSVNGPGAHLISNIEVDGRRNVGGPAYGAMGLTVQNTVGAYIQSCSVHHVRAATYAIFQSVDGIMVDCVSDATGARLRRIGDGGINLERSAGWQIAHPTIIGRPGHVHMTHSNDNWLLKRDGRRHSVKDGALLVVNPKYNDLWGDNLFYVQSWTPYWNGDTMRTPPRVTIHDWKTHLPYKWVHRSHLLVR